MTDDTAIHSNVIRLWPREKTMNSALVSDVIRYWDGLRGARLVPDRAEIDPRGIEAALGHSFILDRTRPGIVRFRLAGMHLNELMGMEVRGMPVRAFFELPDRKQLMELVEAVFLGPCSLDLELVSDAQGRAPLEGRMTLLPLADSDGQVNRALGVLVTDGIVGVPPRRFRIRRAGLTPLVAGRPFAALVPRLGNPGAPRPSRRDAPGQGPLIQGDPAPLRVVQGGKH